MARPGLRTMTRGVSHGAGAHTAGVDCVHRLFHGALEAASLPRAAGRGDSGGLRLPGAGRGNSQDCGLRFRRHPRLHRHRHRLGHHHRSDPRTLRCGDHHGRKRDSTAGRALSDADAVDHRLSGVDPGVLRFGLRHSQLAEECPGGADEGFGRGHERRAGHRPVCHPYLRAADAGPDCRGGQPGAGRVAGAGDRRRLAGLGSGRAGRDALGQPFPQAGRPRAAGRSPQRAARRGRGFRYLASPLRRAAQRLAGLRTDLRAHRADLHRFGRCATGQAAGRGCRVLGAELSRPAGGCFADRPGFRLPAAQGRKQAPAVP